MRELMVPACGNEARRAVRLCLLRGPLLIAAITLVRAAPLLMGHLADLALTRAAVDALLGWLALRSGEMPGHAPEHVTCVEGGSRSSIRPRRGSWSNSRG